jgi:hypothetical protein
MIHPRNRSFNKQSESMDARQQHVTVSHKEEARKSLPNMQIAYELRKHLTRANKMSKAHLLRAVP